MDANGLDVVFIKLQDRIAQISADIDRLEAQDIPDFEVVIAGMKGFRDGLVVGRNEVDSQRTYERVQQESEGE